MNDVQLNTLQLYMNDISNIRMLSPEEEVSLAMLKEAGEISQKILRNGVSSNEQQEELENTVRIGLDANRRLVESNLALVVNIVKRYKVNNVLSMDLIQEGNIGLQNGINRFDYKKGHRLATYAYYWIKKAISLALQKQRSVVLPAHITASISKIKHAARDIEQEESTEASMSDIGERLDIPTERVKELIALSRHPSSLNDDSNGMSEHDGDEEVTLSDVIYDISVDTIDIVEHKMILESIDNELDKILSEEESQVIKYRFGIIDGNYYSIFETSRRTGIRKTSVSVIESRALLKLRESDKMREFLFEKSC